MLSNITNTYSASENVHAMAVKIDQKAKFIESQQLTTILQCLK